MTTLGRLLPVVAVRDFSALATCYAELDGRDRPEAEACPAGTCLALSESPTFAKKKMQLSTYKLELSAGGNAVSTRTVVRSVAEVQAFVAKSLVPDSVLIVTHLKHGADYGNFLIFLNTMGLAYVRLLEHRGFYATRPQTTPTGRAVQFLDNGCPFEVDENSTISAATAIAALEHWLATGQQYPGVCWRDE